MPFFHGNLGGEPFGRINRQTSPQIAPEVFEHVARAYELAVCAALEAPGRSRLPSPLRPLRRPG